jgi:hypothetical protein
VLVSEMLAEIRDHGFDDLTDSRILSFLNDTYYDICTREAWPFLEATASATVNSDGKVTAPTNIDKVLSFHDTGVGRSLSPMRLDDFSSTYASNLTQTGDPYSYYFIGDDVYVYPISSSNSLTVRYIRRPIALTVSPDASPILPIQHHRAVVLGSLVKCYMMEDDFENASMFTNAFEKKLFDMRNNLWFKQYDRTDTIMDVDEPDDVDYLY